MRILVAEKNEVIRKAIQHLLEREGFAVTVVPNGKEVLQKLEQSEYDILMTNLLLQYYSGFEIISKIKLENHYPKMKIVVLSDSFTAENMKRLYQIGIDEMIEKPFSPTEMVLRLQNLGPN